MNSIGSRDKPVVTKGEGVYVFDESGKRYLDAVSGVGVVNIGHNVKEIVEAISKQAKTLAFSYSGIVDNKPRQELASELQEWAPEGMGKTKSVFCSSGAEANEAALKIAYQYHCEKGHPTKRKVISRWQSYHGNTIAALSLSGRTQWRKMYSSYLLDFPHIHPPYCYRCPWGKSYPECGLLCACELERVIRQEGPENVSAFIAEPIIGTSMSAVVPPPEYYRIIRNICDKHDILMIVDEVISGFGRTGTNFAIEHWSITPDIITTAKGISGGFAPLAAVILREKVWRTIAKGSGKIMHSSTYGGNPLSCAAGVAVLSYIKKNNLVERAGEMGTQLLELLSEQLGDLPNVGEVRGKGLFIGIELVADKSTKRVFPPDWNVSQRIVKEAFSDGLLVLRGARGLVDGIAGDHVELLPPYTIESRHLTFIANTLRRSIQKAMTRLPK